MKKFIISIPIIIILAFISILIYARYIGITGLKVKEYYIINKKIPDSFYGFKIIQISDIHYGTVIGKNELENIVEKVNLVKPDIIVITGDLFDSSINYNDTLKQELTDSLKKMNATTGKYFITGENDISYQFYSDVISNSDFINLDNNYDLIYYNSQTPILISGIGYADNKTNAEKMQNFTNFELENPDNNLYKILLVHQPDTISDIDYNKFDLILSGHTHGGEINLPFLRTQFEGSKKYYNSYFTLNSTQVYISSGVGTLKDHSRFNNRPSINLYRIKNK